jgi:Zn-dependent metalloprotease
MDNFNAYISCETGDLVFEQPMVFKTNTIGTAATRYSGTRNITTDSFNGSFRLREVSRGGSNTAIRTFNFLRNPAAYPSETQAGINSAVDFIDNDNNWTAGEYNNANFDNAALDAHWGAETTFDYFRTVHNRNSYDNNNSPIISYVHVRDRDNNGNIVNMDNAFWSENFNAMFYGDGDWLGPLVCLDICAHEFGHAVCKSSAGLVYSAQESGAINESLSDIWGACVENWATTNKQTWICGEDLGFPARSMSNPNLFGQPDTYGGNFWYSGTNANIYVHTNSGVGNFWFFLLSQGGNGTNDMGNAYSVTGIGINKAERIVYRAEVSYLTSSANYAQFRNATISAAINLYGANSQEVISVTDAWHAVGVGNAHPPGVYGPNLICSSGGPYTFIHHNIPVPSGMHLEWRYDSKLEYVSETDNSITLRAKSNQSGNVSVYLVLMSGSTQLAFRGIAQAYAGRPSPITMTVQKQYNSNIYRGTVVTPGATQTQSYSWYAPSGWTVSQDPSVPCGWCTALLSPPNGFSGSGVTIAVYATNACGTNHSLVILPDYSGYVSAYPNPTSGILNIEIDETAVSEMQAAAAGDRQLKLKRDNTFDIRLYDGQGNLLRQKKISGGRTEFNVSGLPSGIYYLHVYDGLNDVPEMRQIVVGK